MSKSALSSFLVLAGLIFALVATAHVARLVSGTAVAIGGASVPMIVSWVGLGIAGAMCLWAFGLLRAVARNP